MKTIKNNKRSYADTFQNNKAAWVVLVISLMLTVVVWYVIDDNVNNRANDRFGYKVDDAMLRISKRMKDYELVLQSGASLFNTLKREPIRSEWRQFISEIKIDQYFPGIQGIGYGKVLHSEQLDNHVQKIRAQGFPDYKVRPDGLRDVYTPIVFLEPFDWRNQRAFGYDMYSESTRKNAMNRARDTGHSSLSGPVILVQETDVDVQQGILMVVPVYAGGSITERLSDRRDELMGYVYAVFRMSDLMHGILTERIPELGFTLSDVTEDSSSEQTPMYVSSDQGEDKIRHRLTRVMSVAGRQWKMEFWSMPEFDLHSSNNQPVIIVIAGLLIDLLLFSVILSLSNSRHRAVKIALDVSQDLADNNERLCLSQQAAGLGTWEWDIWKNIMHWDDQMHALYGTDSRQVVCDYSLWTRYLHPDDQNDAEACMDKAIAGLVDFNTRFRIIREDGSTRHIEANATVIRDEKGHPYRIIGINKDITEQALAEKKLELAARVFRNTHEAIIVAKPDGVILDINNTFSELTQYRSSEITGKLLDQVNQNLLQLVPENDSVFEASGNQRKRSEITIRRKDGTEFPALLWISSVRDKDDDVTNLICGFVDHTQWQEQQHKLQQLAQYDPLTNLPNRILLADRMKLAMAHARRNKTLLAVCLLDLDNFKDINDSLGHSAGDQLLVSVANRLSKFLRDTDTVARLGGDEFILLLSDLENTGSCEEVISQLQMDLTRPYQLDDDKTVTVTSSIGIDIYPDDSVDTDVLLRHADAAMYQAKQSGRNQYMFFDISSVHALREHHDSLFEVGQALEKKELELYYQPCVNMRTGNVEGVEALIRWNHPDGNIRYPDEFLPVIEGTDILVRISEWVLLNAMLQLQSWHASGLQLYMAVNISGHHLQMPSFCNYLRWLLNEFPDIPPVYLELEILETSAFQDLQKVTGIISECRRLGVSVAIDDFGTGYSSFNYLKYFPATTLKVDKSFVLNMASDKDDLAIVKGVIGLAKAFKCKVVAEGVESELAGKELLSLGCEYVQGFGIARPMQADRLPEWVKNYTVKPDWTEDAKIIVYPGKNKRLAVNK